MWWRVIAALLAYHLTIGYFTISPVLEERELTTTDRIEYFVKWPMVVSATIYAQMRIISRMKEQQWERNPQ